METRIEQSRQSFTEELSLKSIMQILVQNWALFLVFFVVIAGGAILFYKFKVPFSSEGSIIINDNKNSSLQSLATQFTGTSATAKTNEAKKGNSSVQKDIEYLRTTQFYLKLIEKLDVPGDGARRTLAEQSGLEKFRSEILEGKPAAKLSPDEQMSAIRKVDGMFRFTIRSDYQVLMTIAAHDAELVYYLSKNALPLVARELRSLEEEDLQKMREFLTRQKNESDVKIQALNKQLGDFQSKPENLISLSVSRVGDYLSELTVRKNETRMKISENAKLVRALGAGSGNAARGAVYGSGGKIQALQIENEMLRAKMSDIQASIDRVLQQAKNIPGAGITYDELRKKSELEFQNYKQLTESLAKVDAYQLALNHKFEVLETPRFDRVRPLVSLTVLLLASLVLAQALGSVVIYLRAIWETKYVTAEQTRNIVVIDGHSFDPRVFIENSKIKFRLKASSSNPSSKSQSPKRLGFNFGPVKQTREPQAEGYGTGLNPAAEKS